MNTRRLELEDEARVAQTPVLKTAPDAELLLIRETGTDWLALATTTVMQKHRCTFAQALPAIRELLFDVRDTVPEAELWAVPLARVMVLPPSAEAARQRRRAATAAREF